MKSWEQYKTFVRKNHHWLAQIESLGSTATWFIPERLASSDVGPEAVSTVIGLFSLVNQHIVHESFEENENDPFSESATTLQVPFRLFVVFLREVEVLVEMISVSRLGEDKKWTTIAIVEFLKATFRTAILVDSGGKMLLEGGVTANDEEGTAENEKVNSESGTDSKSDYPEKAMQAFLRFKQKAIEDAQQLQTLKINKNFTFGKAIELNPSIERTVWPKFTLFRENNKFLENLSSWEAKVKFAAELIHIFRPLLYVLMIRKYGIKSWKPWLLSAVVEVTSLGLIWPKKTSSAQNSDEVETQELKRRKTLLALYLMRSPCFDKVTRHPLQVTQRLFQSIPLLGGLSDRVMELLLGVQSYYFYTSGS